MADSSRRRRGRKRRVDGERHGGTTRTAGNVADLFVDFEHFASAYPDFADAWSNLKARRATGAASDDRAPPAGGVAPGASGSFSTHVDFAFNLALTRAILRSNFGLRLPSMPAGRLCPPVPNRLNYVVWIKNLLRESGDSAYFDLPSRGEELEYRFRGIDLGCGASCIYPLLLTTSRFSDDRRWKFLATEVDEESARSAKVNVEANSLEDRIEVAIVRGTDRQMRRGLGKGDEECDSEALVGPVRIAVENARVWSTAPGRAAEDGTSTVAAHFDFCMTNPPFYSTLCQATEPRRGDGRSRTDMTASEGVYPGGEEGFVRDMIRDSLQLVDCVTWYTSMLGKKSTLVELEKELRRLVGRGAVRTTTFVQGRTMRWGIAWTFRVVNVRSPATKVEGGLQSFEVILNNPEVDALDEVVGRIRSYCQWITTSKGLRLECSTRESNISRICTMVEGGPAAASGKIRRLPQEGHFLIDARIKQLGNITDEASGRADRPVGDESRRVEVRLECFSHSAVGSANIETFRSQISGEVGRTNRRWRRILVKEETELSEGSIGDSPAGAP